MAPKLQNTKTVATVRDAAAALRGRAAQMETRTELEELIAILKARSVMPPQTLLSKTPAGVSGIWSLELGVIRGAWSLEPGAWSLEWSVESSSSRAPSQFAPSKCYLRDFHGSHVRVRCRS